MHARHVGRRGTRFVAAVLATATAAALLSACQPAKPGFVLNPKAGVNTSAYAWGSDGNPEPIPEPAAVNLQLAQLGVGWVRVWIPWARINPNSSGPDQYRYSYVEPAIQSLHARGVKVLVSFLAVPIWARRSVKAGDRSFDPKNCVSAWHSGDAFGDPKVDPHPSDGGPGTPPRAGVFGTFIRDFTTHFRGAVNAYDFWNEPSSKEGCMWSGSRDEFRNRIMIEGFDAAKAVDPSVLVGGSGAVHVGESGSPADDFDGWMTYHDKNTNRDVLVKPFDFFAFDVYAQASLIHSRFDAMDKFSRCTSDNKYCLNSYMLTEFGFQIGDANSGNLTDNATRTADPGAAAVTVYKDCAARSKCMAAFIWDIWRPSPWMGHDFCLLAGFPAAPGMPVQSCGDNKYAAIKAYLNPGRLANAYDATGDGTADLVWYENWNGASAHVFASSGAGFNYMSTPWLSGGKPDWAALGDVNGDGNADIVWYAAANRAGVTVLLSNGNTFVWKQQWLTGLERPDWASLADVDGDGKADLVWYSRASGNVHVFLSNGTTFIDSGIWAAGAGAPDWAAAGDVNGDGKADIVWYENANLAGVTVLLGGEHGFVWDRQWVAGLGRPDWAALADVTGDGQADLLWYEQWNNTSIHVLSSNGKSFDYIGQPWATGLGMPDWAAAMDVTGDGRADLVWYEQASNGRISVASSNGASFDYRGVWATGIGAPDWAGAGSFSHTDGDGSR